MAFKSMAIREVGALVIAVNSANTPTDEDWNAFMQLVRRKFARERIRSLAVTAGGGPNTKQRQMIRDVIGTEPVPAAVVSDAPLVRGIVTALGWFNSAIRSFPFNRGAGLRDALTYLGFEGAMADRVVREVAEMQREVGNAFSRSVRREPWTRHRRAWKSGGCSGSKSTSSPSDVEARRER